MERNYISESYDSSDLASVSLSVCECGWQLSGKGHSYGPIVRDHYVIHYVVAGSGQFCAGERSWQLGKGDGFLIVPGIATSYQADEQDPWEYYWVGFWGSEAQKLLNLSALSAESPIFHYVKDDLLTRHIADLYYASCNYSSRQFAMIGHLYLFFSCMITQRVAKGSPAEICLDKAIHYIEENSNRSITVGEVARYTGVERSTLYRAFMQRLGVSVCDYIRRCKMARARSQLESGMPVSQVGYSLGYTDPAHFSKAFKREYGLSPTAWVRQAELPGGAERPPCTENN